ncbi:hypothetical protein B9Z55_017905 [Caenorhabditis nigoni]|uniref:7TM GPCR serpentine receptor class x (Srx) domain-containing protein n=2 Tax=Caenorhabditis nigoni TaxID=1611254 RepID=A0A2G5TBP6_9PELO|nr:hypothetical protein B9Z55_017905 [Caenorhabditis nigoni]
MLDWSITILIVPFVLFPTAAGFGLGLLDMLGISLRYQCTLFAAIIWSVLVATVTVFENRYNLIYGRGTSWAKFRYPLLAANWISAFAYPLPAFLAFPEQTEALKIVMTTLPPLPDYILKHQIDVYMTDLHYFIIPMIIMTGILATEMAVIGKLMHSATHSVAKKCRMSQKTMALQKAILRGLLIQVLNIFYIFEFLIFQKFKVEFLNVFVSFWST